MKRFVLVIGVLLLGAAAFFLMQKETAKKRSRKKADTHPEVDSSAIIRKTIAAKLDTFFTELSLKKGFSGSVLISVKGNPVYEKCFGYCDYRNKDLITDTNSFQLASVSKNFTAAAVLWCAEHELLSLDDSLQKFFPKLSYKGIRVKDLLCHRSGLPNYLYFCTPICNKGEYLSNKEVIDYMVRKKPRVYARPNRKFEYCNTNYLLLASIVEKVTGLRFKDFMHDTFFAPMGMKHTFVYDANDSVDRKIAISYNSRWQIQGDDCYDGAVGDKGVYSTVHDMFLWDKSYYDGKLLGQEMLEEMYKPRSFEKRGKRNYGYGWRLIEQPDSSYLVYHNGWWHGNNTVFYRNIVDTTSIIILSNKYNRAVYKVQPVFDIIYGFKNDASDSEEE